MTTAWREVKTIRTLVRREMQARAKTARKKKKSNFGKNQNTWLQTRAGKYNLSALGTYFESEG